MDEPAGAAGRSFSDDEEREADETLTPETTGRAERLKLEVELERMTDTDELNDDELNDDALITALDDELLVDEDDGRFVVVVPSPR